MTLGAMTLDWLIGWWNLVFLVPFAIALSYLGLYIATGITFGDADADAGHDAADGGHDVNSHDVHAEVDGHEFDADADADVDADADADAHADGDADDGQGHASSFSILSLVGVGRVPLSLVVMILLMTWGIGGFMMNQALHRATTLSGDAIALLSMPAAAFVAIAVTAILSRFFGSLFPMNEAPAMGLAHLVGETGVAVLRIDDRFGLARVAKPGGAGIQVPCRVAPGQEPIAADHPVLMLRFDRAERLFYVTTPPTTVETPP